LSPAPTSASITREHGGVTVIIRRWTATTAADRLQAAPHEVAEALLLRAAAVEVEEVDAVQRGVVAERVPDADAAEKGVPEVVGDVPGGGRGVVAAVDDGEEHGDVVGALAVLDVGADGGGVVAGEVGEVLPAAGDSEEGDEDGGVEASVAGLRKGALGSVPAPDDRELATGLARGGGWIRGDEEEGEEEAAGENCLGQEW
jgi:hypothetical protein